jgi:hypothetical protein
MYISPLLFAVMQTKENVKMGHRQFLHVAPPSPATFFVATVVPIADRPKKSETEMADAILQLIK